MSFIASYEDGEPELKSAEFLARIADVLGPDYRQHEDRCFHWLTPLSQPEHEQVARQAHYAVSRLPEVLPGLDPRPTAEAWPVVLLADLDDQLAYHDLFPDSGETIIDGGCWRLWPVGHLAIPVGSQREFDGVFAHELVHAMLDPDGVPGWIQEGFACEAETRLGLRPSPFQDRDDLEATLHFWRHHPLDAFWSAEAFRQPESSPHAYRLAQIITTRWANDRSAIAAIRKVGAEGWEDQEAVLFHQFGLERAGIFAAISVRPRRMGWIERMLYGMFVGEKR